MILNNIISQNVNKIVRQINGAVELYDSAVLLDTYKKDGELQEFTIERVGENKFFGFGVAHKANIKVRDINRTKSPKAGNLVNFKFDNVKLFPNLKISEVHRDEKTNQLSITAYDCLKETNNIDYLSLNMPEEYTPNDLINKAVEILGLKGNAVINVSDGSFDILYKANFDENNNLRDVLNNVAEVTQTIYYINYEDKLVFKRLNKSGVENLTIDKSKYFSFKESDNKRLQTIVKTTELGDNVSKSTTQIGSTQYIRNNGFWELRDDIPQLLDKAILAVGDLTIAQFECEWRGNPLLEIGDKFNLQTKDNSFMASFLLDDTLTYNGSLKQKSKWKFEKENEESSNPSTIGEIINETTARVDKVNKEITLVVKDTEENKETLSQLKVDTSGLNATVTDIQKNVDDSLNSIDGQLVDINKQVDAKLDSDGFELKVQKQIDNGVTKVDTGMGFKFDETGLNVSKNGSPMSTKITEDGMKISKDGQETLVANNQGVDAINLHATTYLIIGNNSRIEDYGSDRTACFWIGN